MTTDTSDLEMLIGPNDVCALLNIKESTLRKYAHILKDAGISLMSMIKGKEDILIKTLL
jgi:hypothetical protein